MKTLTVRQPFAHLIISGEKRVENRLWGARPPPPEDSPIAQPPAGIPPPPPIWLYWPPYNMPPYNMW